jgi:hypothetical protein
VFSRRYHSLLKLTLAIAIVWSGSFPAPANCQTRAAICSTNGCCTERFHAEAPDAATGSASSARAAKLVESRGVCCCRGAKLREQHAAKRLSCCSAKRPGLGSVQSAELQSRTSPLTAVATVCRCALQAPQPTPAPSRPDQQEQRGDDARFAHSVSLDVMPVRVDVQPVGCPRAFLFCHDCTSQQRQAILCRWLT